MENKITLLGNGGSYSDYDIIAVVLEDHDTVEKLRIEYFKQICHYKIRASWNNTTLFLCWNCETYDQFRAHNKWFQEKRVGGTITANDFVPVTDKDARENYEYTDRSGFINYLRESGVIIINDPDSIG